MHLFVQSNKSNNLLKRLKKWYSSQNVVSKDNQW
jgi:hypothetical protein